MPLILPILLATVKSPVRNSASLATCVQCPIPVSPQHIKYFDLNHFQSALFFVRCSINIQSANNSLILLFYDSTLALCYYYVYIHLCQWKLIIMLGLRRTTNYFRLASRLSKTSIFGYESFSPHFPSKYSGRCKSIDEPKLISMIS